MAVVNPVTVGAAVRTVGAAWNIITSGGLSKKERAAIEAARDQGYTTGARGYRDPSGRVVSQADVISAGKRPSEPGYRPDLTEKRIPPLVRTPPPKAPRVPKIPGRLGRIAEGIGAVAGGTGLFEVIRGGIERIGERDPLPAPPPPAAPLPAPPAEASPDEIIGGRSPFYAPPGVKQPIPAPIPRPPAAPLPAPPPAAPAPIDTDRLSPIDVYVPYAAIPAPPAPSGSGAAAPRSILGMSPAQLAGIAIPTLLALLAGSSSSGRRRRDPLTPPGFPDLGNIPGIPGTNLVPGVGVSPWPGADAPPTFWGGGNVATDQCSCPPKRKRPKSKRTVCYSGTFSERASGLSKQRKRKIPCR